MATRENTKNRALKMLTCYTCKNTVEERNTLLCMNCDNRFEFDCAGYSEKLYRLLDHKARKKWKCKNCLQLKKCSETSKIERSNITVRKKQSPKIGSIKPVHPSTPKIIEEITTPNLTLISGTSQNNEDIPATFQTSCISDAMDSHILTANTSLDDSYLSPKLSKSLDYTLNNGTTLRDMKNTISQLKANLESITKALESTQEELENKILENNDQRRQLCKCTEEINFLKNLCKSPKPMNNLSSTIKKMKKRSIFLPDLPITSSPLYVNKSANDLPNIDSSKDVFTLEQKIDSLNYELAYARKEITKLNDEINRLIRNKLDIASMTHLTCTKSFSMEAPSCTMKKKYKPVIRIFGTQQCAGLSSALSYSREETNYEKYFIYSEIKPNAMSCEVLKSLKYTNVQCSDKIILGIGENDYNHNLVLSQLRLVLKKYNNIPVFVLNVCKNSYTNVNKINRGLNDICKESKNCYFIKCNTHQKIDICKILNYSIDTFDYEHKFINNIKKLLRKGVNGEPRVTTTLIRKGTIPYYFARVPESHHKCSKDIASPHLMYKKGTIPFYFPTTKKLSFFRE